MKFSPNMLSSVAENWSFSGATLSKDVLTMQAGGRASTVIAAINGVNQAPSHLFLRACASTYSDRYTPDIVVQIEVTYEDASTITFSTPLIEEIANGITLPVKTEATDNVVPFSSIRFGVYSLVPTAISNFELCASITNIVVEEKDYYGVKLSSAEGIKITHSDGLGEVILNSDVFAMRSKVGEMLIDRIYFDPTTGNYNFTGDVNVTGGSINIGDNFVVDRNGNVLLSGDATIAGATNIYSGRFFAGDPTAASGFSQMTPNGFEVHSSKSRKVLLGYTGDDVDFPFLLLGEGDGTPNSVGLFKKFSNGLWVGNSAPKDAEGRFEAKADYNGIFFDFDENVAYVVINKSMKALFTGDTVAKFG